MNANQKLNLLKCDILGSSYKFIQSSDKVKESFTTDVINAIEAFCIDCPNEKDLRKSAYIYASTTPAARYTTGRPTCTTLFWKTETTKWLTKKANEQPAAAGRALKSGGGGIFKPVCGEILMKQQL